MGEMAVGGTASERVVGALRDRIRRGELAAGDHVPSTREIVREWGVAMATASKVLAALRAEGLVRPVRGVGTVVVGAAETVAAPAPRRSARPRTRTAGPGLTTARIVSAAVAIADAEGLAALSMRHVATELEVATMSLYRHVGDKDDLILRMMDAVFEEWTPPVETPSDWRERVERVSRAMWERFRRHPWLASALSLTRPQVLVSGMAYSNEMLAGLTALGLGSTAAFDAQMILFTFVRGLAVSLESEQQAEADTGTTADQWVDENETATRAAMASRELAALRQVVGNLTAGGYDMDLDRLFETGLSFLLDGLAARHA